MAENGHISIGRIGESVAEGYLQNRGYTILEKNYRKPWGEIDIITKYRGVFHFIEVKAGSWKRRAWPKDGEELYRPEDHMHTKKRERLARAVQTYLIDHNLDPQTTEWTMDLLVVLLNQETRRARVRVYENILLLD